MLRRTKTGYSGDESGFLLVWDKELIKDRSEDHSEEEILVREFIYTGGIKIIGSKMLTSSDGFGSISINDFW